MKTLIVLALTLSGAFSYATPPQQPHCLKKLSHIEMLSAVASSEDLRLQLRGGVDIAGLEVTRLAASGQAARIKVTFLNLAGYRSNVMYDAYVDCANGNIVLHH